MGVSPIFVAVVGGLGLGGLYFLWRKQQVTAANQSCAELCALVPEGAQRDACMAACQLAGAILPVLGDIATAVSPFNDSSEDWDHEVKRRRDNNDTLNGAVAVNRDLGGGGKGLLTGGPIEYANGCEPYFGAPGWGKCAAGTLDMYAMAVDAATPVNDAGWSEANATVSPMFMSLADQAAVQAARAQQVDQSQHWYQLSLDASYDPTSDTSYAYAAHLNKNAFNIGAAGDPLSYGPWKNADVTKGVLGAPTWMIRGSIVVGAEGLAPRSVVMSIGPQVPGRDAIADITALTDAQAQQMIPIPTGSGTGTTVAIDCNAVQAKDATFTWDVGGFWRRMRAGETRNLGPCAGASSSSSGTTKSGGIGGTFGFGILGL